MKICWDNLNKLIYKEGKLYIKRTEKYFKICETCKEEYIGSIDQRFCSKNCVRKTDEQKRKISDALSGDKNPFYGKTHTEKVKNRLSEVASSRRGEKSSNFGNRGEKSKLFGRKRPEHSEFMKTRTGPLNSGWKGGQKTAKYEEFSQSIGLYEEIRRCKEDEKTIEVRCKYCNKWFKPTKPQIKCRLYAIEGRMSGEQLLYCSDGCKGACPIFKKKVFPVGFGTDKSIEVSSELRKMVLERDNWACQKCGLSSDIACVELHCHHIDPVKLNPIESADVDNCVTLCKDCHKEAHQKDGCKTGQLASC